MPTKRKYTPPRTYRDEWNQYPLLRIEGGFRPFRLSPAKCGAILEVLDEIKAFYEEFKPKPVEPAKAPEFQPATPEELAIIAKYIPQPHEDA